MYLCNETVDFLTLPSGTRVRVRARSEEVLVQRPFATRSEQKLTGGMCSPHLDRKNLFLSA